MKSLKLYTIYWEVDGSSGNTQVKATGVDMVRQYFKANFPGYKLISIEQNGFAHNPVKKRKTGVTASARDRYFTCPECEANFKLVKGCLPPHRGYFNKQCSGSGMKLNPAKRKTKRTRTPSQKAATARMLAANKARRGVRHNPSKKVKSTFGHYTIAELRKTASEWHSGQTSPLYAFASTGAVTSGLYRDATKTSQEATGEDFNKLQVIATLPVTHPDKYEENPRRRKAPKWKAGKRTPAQRSARKRVNTVAGYYPNATMTVAERRASQARARRRAAKTSKLTNQAGKYKVYAWTDNEFRSHIATFADKVKAFEYARGYNAKYKCRVTVET